MRIRARVWQLAGMILGSSLWLFFVSVVSVPLVARTMRLTGTFVFVLFCYVTGFLLCILLALRLPFCGKDRVKRRKFFIMCFNSWGGGFETTYTLHIRTMRNNLNQTRICGSLL